MVGLDSFEMVCRKTSFDFVVVVVVVFIVLITSTCFVKFFA